MHPQRMAGAARLICLVSFLGGIFSVSPISAKRTPPPEIPPLVENGITYTVETKTLAEKSPKKFVCELVARKGQTELWRKPVYEIRMDPALERDVQHVYPVSLRREGAPGSAPAAFTIEAENHRTYRVVTGGTP